MKVNTINEKIEVELQQDELLMLNAALNEVCNGIDMFEFDTRMGATRTQVETLMKEIQSVLDQIDKR